MRVGAVSESGGSSWRDRIPSLSAFKATTDTFLKVCTATKSFWKLSIFKMPSFYSSCFQKVKIVRVLRVPEQVDKVRNSKTPYQFSFAAITLYFTTFEIREALNWVPAAELPVVATLGLVSVEGFRQSFLVQEKLRSKQEIALYGSMDEFDAYCKSFSHAKEEVWQNGCNVAASVSLASMCAMPSAKIFFSMFNFFKGVGAVFTLYRTCRPQ